MVTVDRPPRAEEGVEVVPVEELVLTPAATPACVLVLWLEPFVGRVETVESVVGPVDVGGAALEVGAFCVVG